MARDRKSDAQLRQEAVELLPATGELTKADYFAALDNAGLSSVKSSLIDMKHAGLINVRLEGQPDGTTLTMFISRPPQV